MNKQFTSLPAALAVVALTLTGCSKPASNTSADQKIQQLETQISALKKQLGERSPAAPSQTTRKAHPDFPPIWGNQLYEEYVRNGAAFEQRYKGKTVCVFGDIAAVDPDQVFIRCGSGYGGDPPVMHFHFDSGETAPLAAMQRGAKVRVLGVYEGREDAKFCPAGREVMTINHCVVAE